MATNPSWWKHEYSSGWERVKAAFKRDWEQTKHDFGGKAPDLNQDVPDTLKQAAGKQAIPPPTVPNFEESESASRFGYGARQHYKEKYSKWGDKGLEEQLKTDWTSIRGGTSEDFTQHRDAIRRGWEYTAAANTGGASASCVRDVMTANPECAQVDSTIKEAASKMKSLNVGSLPVCGNDDRLAGMVTDRDIAIRAVAEGKPHTTKVSEIMTPDVCYCFEDQSVREAAELMQEKQIRRLVVLNADKRLVGIVALADLALDTGDDRLTGDTVEAISEPASLKPR